MRAVVLPSQSTKMVYQTCVVLFQQGCYNHDITILHVLHYFPATPNHVSVRNTISLPHFKLNKLEHNMNINYYDLSSVQITL